MAVDLPLKLKRREIILLAIIFLLIFGIYQSSAAANNVWTDSPALSVLFGAMSCINIYFVYRSLFNQRYIGVVASLLLAFSPWFFQSSISPENYTLWSFVITGAVWAWAAWSLIIWGAVFAFALATNIASAALLLPFIGHAYFYRQSITDRKRLIVGVVIAAAASLAIVFLAPGLTPPSLGWTDAAQYVRFGEKQGAALSTIQPAGYIVFLTYLVLVGGFAYTFNDRKKIRRYGLAVLLIAIPYLTLFYLNLPSVQATSGLALTVLSLLAPPALWPVDGKRREVIFLLLWLLPSFIIFPFLNINEPTLYGFLTLPLALLACRLLDRSLDGEWLDFWWALGLPSKWYYRMGKIFVLVILIFSFYQTTRA